MVEAPGTAPGSDGFIPIAIYRHSRCRHTQYRVFGAKMQSQVCFLEVAFFTPANFLAPRVSPREGALSWTNRGRERYWGDMSPRPNLRSTTL